MSAVALLFGKVLVAGIGAFFLLVAVLVIVIMLNPPKTYKPESAE